METTHTHTTVQSSNRQAAVNALAIVGFIVLIIIGMALAIYAARFVPAALSRVGSAAVYLSSQVFPADEDTDLVVVPQQNETIPFPGTTATSTATTTQPITPSTPATTPTTPGTPTTVVVPVAVPASTNYHGLSDLVIEDIQTGYLTSADTDTFRASDEVPDGRRGAVKFTIANRGTNVSERFDFEVKIPTTRSYTYSSRTQQALRPNERIVYVLGFDQGKEGDNREITISVDQDDDVKESNENNNDRTVRIDIQD